MAKAKPQSRSKLADYDAKRDFSKTREPAGEPGEARTDGLAFLVQKHAARRLHYDLRLEWDGVLLSWAVTKGPSDDPSQKRLAVRTEDHPLSYGEFEGGIPERQYGGGTVMLWDTGTWTPLHDVDEGLAAGKLHFTISGSRMQGGWALVRLGGKAGASGKSKSKRENWLLIKERDALAGDTPDRLTEDFQTSLASGRDMAEIAGEAPWKQSAREKARPENKKAGAARAAKSSNSKSRTGKASRLDNPGFRKPQLATLVGEAPQGADWLHETKFDGYRCLVSLGRDGARFFTRSGLDWTEKFRDLEPACAAISCRNALIDGEVMAAGAAQASAFSALQKVLKEGGALSYYAFDLLELDGTDLTARPLTDRKAALEALLEAAGTEAKPGGPGLHYSEHVTGHGAEVFKQVCAGGGEGIISKKADAPYRGARSRGWQKVKCSRRREFVVGGFSPSSKRGRPFASLLVGEFSGNHLRYRGRVGSGFSERDLEALAAAMGELSRKTSPFGAVPGEIGRQARWVAPDLVVDVDFNEFTADGHIRHGVFLGLREDKMAKSVTKETDNSARDSATAAAAGPVIVAGISISHPARDVFPEAGLSKLDLARYYERAGDRMIAILGHRPFSLVRCPDGLAGDCFYQRHAGKGFPAQLKPIAIAEKSGKSADYLTAAASAGLVAAVQMGSIEFHIWGARTDLVEKPDRMVFDLDPDEGLGFETVKDAAFDIRDRLDDLGLACSAMVTGGKGVHVVVHLRRTVSWETVTIFSKTFATILAEGEPQRFVATLSKAKRKGKIFIDWLRNERGSTAIAPYSVRARKGAPVATPVTWEELADLDRANGFSIPDMDARLSQPCPCLEAGKDLQTLSKTVIGKLEKMAAA